jgi:hypothetical protein
MVNLMREVFEGTQKRGEIGENFREDKAQES